MERWGYTFWKYPFLKHGMRNCFFYPFTYYTQCISLSPGCWFSVCLGAMFPISTLQFLGQEPPQEVPVSILVELKGSVSVCGLEVQCGYKYKHKNSCVIHKNASWPLKVIVGCAQWAHGPASLTSRIRTLCVLVMPCGGLAIPVVSRRKEAHFSFTWGGRLGYVGIDDFEVFQDELCPLKVLC